MTNVIEQFNSILFMHARQPFFNICNTAILGYHGDNLI